MPELIKDTQGFESKIKSPNLSVIHFAADFVEQCKHVDDLLDTLASQPDYSKVLFLKCQAEDLSEVSLKCQIEAAPTIIFFRNGKKVDRVDGAVPAKITAKLKELVAGMGDEKPLEERLKSLINKGKVTLFMKGDRNQPRCGFSRQTIDILNNTNIPYETFDILTDEEVRQGLKKYSDWPTYPQLYVNGELIGGLDIIKEILASGELVETLNG